jgi:putative redox protein
MTMGDESTRDPPGGVTQLIVAAELESGPVPYGQTISIGHHEVACDEPASRGGGDAGPSPSGLLLAALAGCTSITLRMYADRKGWDLGQVKVSLKLLRDADVERVERTIRLGGTLAPEQLERLREIAEKTPVTKTLKRGLAIATELG